MCYIITQHFLTIVTIEQKTVDFFYRFAIIDVYARAHEMSIA